MSESVSIIKTQMPIEGQTVKWLMFGRIELLGNPAINEPMQTGDLFSVVGHCQRELAQVVFSITKDGFLVFRLKPTIGEHVDTRLSFLSKEDVVIRLKPKQRRLWRYLP